jgi:hypothetical protein
MHYEEVGNIGRIDALPHDKDPDTLLGFNTLTMPATFRCLACRMFAAQHFANIRAGVSPANILHKISLRKENL